MNKEHKHSQLKRKSIGQPITNIPPVYESREQTRFLVSPLSCRRVKFLMSCTSHSLAHSLTQSLTHTNMHPHDGKTFTRKLVRNGFIIVNDGWIVCIRFRGTTKTTNKSKNENVCTEKMCQRFDRLTTEELAHSSELAKGKEATVNYWWLRVLQFGEHAGQLHWLQFKKKIIYWPQTTFSGSKCKQF